MRLIRLYQDLDNLYAGATITLSTQASHKLVNVLRVKLQQKIEIFNSNHSFLGVIAKINKKQVQVYLKSPNSNSLESPLNIHLALGLSKNDRLTLALEKAVELGVTQITPLLTDYCDLKQSAQLLEKKIPHWQQKIIHATEQCGRITLPKLNRPIHLTKFIDILNNNTLKLFFEPSLKNPIQLKTLKNKTNEITCLVGPVGGWSTTEITLLQKNQFLGLTLGPRILRYETAAAAGLTLIQYYFGDL